MPNHYVGDLLLTIEMSGLSRVRTELLQLAGTLRESFSLALPTLWHIDDRDSEIYCCGTISMHVLRFFLTRPSVATRGCTPARRYIRVLTRGPALLSPPSTNTLAALCTTAHGLDPLLQCLPIDPLRPKPPFKSHSAPRPPQTPAASS